MGLEQALKVVKECQSRPIDSPEMVDQCITALAYSLDATDGAMFLLQAGMLAGWSALLLLAAFTLRQGFKLARLQGEFNAYRSGIASVAAAGS